jgi:hypothetical protein
MMHLLPHVGCAVWPPVTDSFGKLTTAVAASARRQACRLGLMPGLRGAVRRSGAHARIRRTNRLWLSLQSQSIQRGIKWQRIDPRVGGSVHPRRGMDHLRSDQSRCRGIQSDPRRRRARHSTDHAGGRQFRGNARCVSGDVSGSPGLNLEKH